MRVGTAGPLRSKCSCPSAPEGSPSASHLPRSLSLPSKLAEAPPCLTWHFPFPLCSPTATPPRRLGTPVTRGSLVPACSGAGLQRARPTSHSHQLQGKSKSQPSGTKGQRADFVSEGDFVLHTLDIIVLAAALAPTPVLTPRGRCSRRAQF